MKRKIALLLMLAFIAGCNQPVITPPGDVTTTVGTAEPDATGVLGGFMGTACASSKTYIMIDSYWGFVSPFLPAAVKANALPILNMFLPALKTFDKAVITWYETKAKPNDWDNIIKNVQETWAQVQPLIEEIKNKIAENKKSTDKALEATKEVSKEAQAKAITSCPVKQLTDYYETLITLKPLA